MTITNSKQVLPCLSIKVWVCYVIVLVYFAWVAWRVAFFCFVGKSHHVLEEIIFLQAFCCHWPFEVLSHKVNNWSWIISIGVLLISWFGLTLWMVAWPWIFCLKNHLFKKGLFISFERYSSMYSSLIHWDIMEFRRQVQITLFGEILQCRYP